MKTHGTPQKPARQAESPDATAAPAVPPGLRRFLFLTSCLNGAAIMIVEILGAKMLSPYIGTSHFVWTAQIAVTMAALALGYWLGGKLVDRTARLARLYWAILAAAAYIALSVALRERVAYGLLVLPLAAASLLTSIILYFVPLCLLAMTGPFLVRFITGSLKEVGGTVGRLNAVSTIGSFLGTVAISYLLIPLLPNSVTMFATAGVLALLAIVYLVAWGRRARAIVGAAVVVAAGLTAGILGLRAEGLRNPGFEELYRGNSNFGLLQVLQARGAPERYYLNDYLPQNTYDVVQGRSTSMFTYMLEGLARAYAPRLDRVLCIGMGVGIVPRDLARAGVKVDVVEINPGVVPLARKYFDLDTREFALSIGDGRVFVDRSRERYDAVILDAFLGDSTPAHLMSREAFAAIRRILQPDGVLVINTFAEFGERTDFFGASLYRTLAAVFPGVKVHGARGANTLFVASPRADLAMLHEPDFRAVHPRAIDEVRAAFTGTWQPDPSAGIVLTDDFNPVEYHDAANREKYRRTLALSVAGR
jgi:predicted membrane-bound spermidine synthase